MPEQLTILDARGDATAPAWEGGPVSVRGAVRFAAPLPVSRGPEAARAAAEAIGGLPPSGRMTAFEFAAAHGASPGEYAFWATYGAEAQGPGAGPRAGRGVSVGIMIKNP